jgi:hypothetical protein
MSFTTSYLPLLACTPLRSSTGLSTSTLLRLRAEAYTRTEVHATLVACFARMPRRGPTASGSHSPWSPVSLTRPLPMLRGCVPRGPGSPTARSVGRRSSICRTPPASPARWSRFSLPTGECPATCGDRCTGVPQGSVWDEELDHLPLFVGEQRPFGSYRGRLRSSSGGVASGRSLSAEDAFGRSACLAWWTIWSTVIGSASAPLTRAALTV